MRLFVALDIPEDIKEALFAFTIKTFSHVSSFVPTRRENLHITLKFIGDLDVPKRKEKEILSDISKRIVRGCKDIGPFPVILGHIEYFKQRKFTVYSRVDSPLVLPRLIRQLRRQFLGVGKKDSQRIFPHVTIGRCSERGEIGIEEKIRTVKIERIGFLASTIVLYESVLASSGPSYFPKITFALPF
ncbi:RNA 2',3'-cyclic phosphodiesterase [Candidatus Gottesmanbacteria bacterium]|nr:RNA 2',3'-cyclic phosphodiesterase [Candidatus Gottesmanbacteria bacterium]